MNYLVVNDNTGYLAKYKGKVILTHDEAVFIVAYRLGCANIPHHIETFEEN